MYLYCSSQKVSHLKGLSILEPTPMSLRAPQAPPFPWQKATASGFSQCARMKASRPERGSIEVLLLRGWPGLSRKWLLLQGSDQWHWQRPSHSFGMERGGGRTWGGVWKEAARAREGEVKGRSFTKTDRALILIILLMSSLVDVNNNTRIGFKHGNKTAIVCILNHLVKSWKSVAKKYNDLCVFAFDCVSSPWKSKSLCPHSHYMHIYVFL